MGALFMNWLWKRLEPRIQAVITDRILKFNAGLIERGQIPKAPQPGPVAENKP